MSSTYVRRNRTPLANRGKPHDLTPSGNSSVGLQAFTWQAAKREHQDSWHEVVAQNAEAIRRAFGEHAPIYLPPFVRSHVDAPEGYIPQLSTRADRFNTQYGSEKELTALNAKLKRLGLVSIGDYVMNHFSGGPDALGNPTWGDTSVVGLGPEAVTSDDEWEGARGIADTGDGVPYARDWDLTNSEVLDYHRNVLREAQETLGYQGVRLDYARGFSPEIAGQVLKSTFAGKEAVAVAELWLPLDLNDVDAHRQTLVDWVNRAERRAAVFDFTTKGVLQHSVATGELWRLADRDLRPSGLIGWDPASAWTFIDNHDTGISGGQGHWAFPEDRIIAGYAYIISHPGTPMVFWPHFFDWGQEVQDDLVSLMALRRTAGVTPVSPVEILAAGQDLYAARVDGEEGSLLLKLGSGSWAPDDGGWHLRQSGESYAIWLKPHDAPDEDWL